MAVTSADPSKISGSPTKAPNRPKIFWIRIGSPTNTSLLPQRHNHGETKKRTSWACSVFRPHPAFWEVAHQHLRRQRVQTLQPINVRPSFARTWPRPMLKEPKSPSKTSPDAPTRVTPLQWKYDANPGLCTSRRLAKPFVLPSLRDGLKSMCLLGRLQGPCWPGCS